MRPQASLKQWAENQRCAATVSNGGSLFTAKCCGIFAGKAPHFHERGKGESGRSKSGRSAILNGFSSGRMAPPSFISAIPHGRGELREPNQSPFTLNTISERRAPLANSRSLGGSAEAFGKSLPPFPSRRSVRQSKIPRR